MDNFMLRIWSVVGNPDKRGGDKALVPRKAEAKARRYAPFFKNVDESKCCVAQCLTGFGQKRAAGGPSYRAAS